MPTSQRSIEASNLNIAREYYLPPLPELHAGIYVSDSFDAKKKEIVSCALQSVLRIAKAESGGEGKR